MLLAFDPSKIFLTAKSSMRALSMGDRLGSPLGVAGFEYLRLSHFFAMGGLSGKKNILLIDVFAIYVGRG